MELKAWSGGGFSPSLFCALRQPGSTNQSGQSCSGLQLFLSTVKEPKVPFQLQKGKKEIFFFLLITENCIDLNCTSVGPLQIKFSYFK